MSHGVIGVLNFSAQAMDGEAGTLAYVYFDERDMDHSFSGGEF